MQRITNVEKIDSGSNYNFPDKLERGFVPRSVFNLSHLVTGTVPNAGIIFPIAWWEYVPTDSFSISIRHLLRVMPQVVPLFSRQRIFIHAFAMNYAELQSDFQTLITKGYSGRTIKQIAPLTTSNFDTTLYDSGDGVVEPDSLADYLGLPQGAKYADLIDNGISCLPFLMYEAIYKHYYMNRNYYIDNKNWLPDDPESFRVDENGVLASNTDDDHPKVVFGNLHYRDYPDDYFTACLPFAQRGDRPTLDISFGEGKMFEFAESLIGMQFRIDNSNITGVPKFGPIFNSDVAQSSVKAAYDFSTDGGQAPDDKVFAMPYSKHGASYPVSTSNSDKYAAGILSDYFNNSIKSNLKSTIGLEELRQLTRAQVELEKMARTDGSYYEFGLTFFNTKMSTSREAKPVYIGGTYSSISFTEVLQTSSSTVASALGQIAGHGISINNKGYLGNFQANDYGIIMLVATIMPDVYYHQGLDKKWSRKYQSEFYLPERAKMGLQPVLNKEIMFTGDSTTDNDLFGYQNPFDDLRYMQNRICGKIADFNNLSFSPYTQARHFESLPTLSQSFAVADDVRKDYLFAPIEDAYTVQFSIDCRAVRPIPYKPIPSNFGL